MQLNDLNARSCLPRGRSVEHAGSKGSSPAIDDWIEWEQSTLRRAAYAHDVSKAQLASSACRLENELQKDEQKAYLLGDSLTAADIAVFCSLLPCYLAGLLTGRTQTYIAALQQHPHVLAGMHKLFGSALDDKASSQILDAWRTECAATKSLSQAAQAALNKRLDAVMSRIDRLEQCLASSSNRGGSELAKASGKFEACPNCR